MRVSSVAPTWRTARRGGNSSSTRLRCPSRPRRARASRCSPLAAMSRRAHRKSHACSNLEASYKARVYVSVCGHALHRRRIPQTYWPRASCSFAAQKKTSARRRSRGSLQTVTVTRSDIGLPYNNNRSSAQRAAQPHKQLKSTAHLAQPAYLIIFIYFYVVTVTSQNMFCHLFRTLLINSSQSSAVLAKW